MKFSERRPVVMRVADGVDLVHGCQLIEIAAARFRADHTDHHRQHRRRDHRRAHAVDGREAAVLHRPEEYGMNAPIAAPAW